MIGSYTPPFENSEYEVYYDVDNFKAPENEKFTNLSRVIDGRRPTKRGEAAIGRDVVNHQEELTIGSIIQFVDSNNMTHDLEVVGILRYSSYIQVFGYDEVMPSQIYLQIDPKVPDLGKEVERLFPGQGVVYNLTVNQLLGMQPGLNPLVLAIAGFAGFLIVLISLASITLIYNSFNLSIENKVK